jgi:hypothetical protein
MRKQLSKITLWIFIESCTVSNISGVKGQMIYLFFPLMMGKEYGWNTSLRKMKFGG